MRLLTFAFLLLCLGCAKEPPYGDTCETDCLIFEGVVLDATTLEPLVTTVALDQYWRGTLLSYGGQETVGRVKTDQHGNYHLSVSSSGYINSAYDGLIVHVVTDKVLPGGYEACELHGYFQTTDINQVNRDTFLLATPGHIDWTYEVAHPFGYKHLEMFYQKPTLNSGIYIANDVIEPVSGEARITVAGVQDVQIGYRYVDNEGRYQTETVTVTTEAGMTISHHTRVE